MFEKGDIAAIEHRLGPELYLVGDKVTNVLYGDVYYKFKSLETRKTSGECKEDALLKYDLYLLANTIKWSNVDLKFTITVPGKLIPIFLNKVQESWFSYDDSKGGINHFDTKFIFEKNEKNQLICRLIKGIELYFMNKEHLFTIKPENLKDLTITNYIIFDNYYHLSDIRFEVDTVTISSDYGINNDVSQYCGFVSQPLFDSGKKAYLSIKVDNKKLYDELYEFLLKSQYSAKATVISTLNDGQIYNICLNNLTSIISKDWHIIDLEYVDVNWQVMDLNYYTKQLEDEILKATGIPRNYLGFDFNSGVITTATEAVEKAKQEYYLKQKLKDNGLNDIDIDELFKGIDDGPLPSRQEYVYYTPSDAKIYYEFYKNEKEKEKETKMRYLVEKLDPTNTDVVEKDVKKEIKQIVINEEEGIVTAIANNAGYHHHGDFKTVTLAKTSKDDEFDKYVGAALAIAYQLFGSKTQFRKYVDNEAKYVKQIKEKKEKAKQKKQGK